MIEYTYIYLVVYEDIEIYRSSEGFETANCYRSALYKYLLGEQDLNLTVIILHFVVIFIMI